MWWFAVGFFSNLSANVKYFVYCISQMPHSTIVIRNPRWFFTSNITKLRTNTTRTSLIRRVRRAIYFHPLVKAYSADRSKVEYLWNGANITRYVIYRSGTWLYYTYRNEAQRERTFMRHLWTFILFCLKYESITTGLYITKDVGRFKRQISSFIRCSRKSCWI